MPTDAPATISLALFRRSNDPNVPRSYHFGVVVSRGAPHGLVDLYEIDNPGSGWELQHAVMGSARGQVMLEDLRTLVGCIVVGAAEGMSVREVGEFISQYGPSPREDDWLVPGKNEWTCASWALRVVADLNSTELLQPTISVGLDKLYYLTYRAGFSFQDGELGAVKDGVRTAMLGDVLS
ncbi:hypothetical protein PsYK624_130260 [Phanerochaete sordida]|uniref:Uncharacterized protein n=1 Tax=Phanerochaete sordida TaxID=48140 RepID=A0A9P3LJM2_9APHY|nr:hypothetical protein PsYK624_130260 [Phanerochaete sordida]